MNSTYHPTQSALRNFAAGALPETVAEELYAHLGDCSACRTRYFSLRSIRADFDAAWDVFVSHARQMAGAPLESNPLVLGVLVRGVVDGVRRLAMAASDRVSKASEGLFDAAFVPRYQGAAGVRGASGTDSVSQDAADMVSRGADDEALVELEKIRRIDPAAAAVARVELRLEGTRAGEIIVDSNRSMVSVLLYPHLVPTGRYIAQIEQPENPTRRLELQPVEGAPYLLAEFESVSTGRFALGIARVEEEIS